MIGTLNIPNRVGQMAATVTDTRIVFARIEIDESCLNPLIDAGKGLIFSFNEDFGGIPMPRVTLLGRILRRNVPSEDYRAWFADLKRAIYPALAERHQRCKNPLSGLLRDQVLRDADAVQLTYYRHSGRGFWAVRGSQVPTNAEVHPDGGVWVPDDLALESFSGTRGGGLARHEWMRQRARRVCAEYSAWRNGDIYAYYITSYRLRTDGRRVLDHEHDYKSDKPLDFDGRGGFSDWQELTEMVGRTVERLVAKS